LSLLVKSDNYRRFSVLSPSLRVIDDQVQEIGLVIAEARASVVKSRRSPSIQYAAAMTLLRRTAMQ
jgi:hypothetical protein